MAAGDVVVSSSHFETFGMTLAEGQAAGCLAVAFDHGGQSDIITHRRDGWLAAYPDADSIAEGILWAVSTARLSTTAWRRGFHTARWRVSI